MCPQDSQCLHHNLLTHEGSWKLEQHYFRLHVVFCVLKEHTHTKKKITHPLVKGDNVLYHVYVHITYILTSNNRTHIFLGHEGSSSPSPVLDDETLSLWLWAHHTVCLIRNLESCWKKKRRRRKNSCVDEAWRWHQIMFWGIVGLEPEEC